MTSPQVSVLMTAYNREKYIAEAIESVLASTLKDFELIIVDDGSKDRTVEIARQYLQDSRVQVQVNEHNLGDYPNRNRAASLARGKYLKYLDADDLIYPYGLGVMVAALERYPEAALAIERPASPREPYPLLVQPREAYREHFLGRGLLNAGPTGAILRASAFHAAGGFSGERYVGDTAMWLKLTARWPVVILPEGLIWWRQHDQQQIAFEQADVMVGTVRHLVSVKALKAADCPLPDAEREAGLRRTSQHHARRLLALGVKQARPVAAWQTFRASGLSWMELLRGLQSYR